MNSSQPNEQLALVGGLEVEESERFLRQVFRHHGSREAIYQLAQLHSTHKAKHPLKWPHHAIHQLICAACAYGKMDRVPIPEEKLRKARNHFLEFTNPAYIFWMNTTYDLEMFGQIAHREQLRLQREPTPESYGRLCRLFLECLAAPARNQLESSLGCKIQDLAKATYVWMLHSMIPGRSVLNPETQKSLEQIGLRNPGLSCLLKLCSISVPDLGSKYLARREAITKKMWRRSLEPIIQETPILDFGQGYYVSPLPNLIFDSMYVQVRNRLREAGLVAEFSSAFENYVQCLLELLQPLRIRRLDQENLQSTRCDILVEFDSFSMLVECKATRFSRNFLSPDTISQDTSTKEIGEGIVQIGESLSEARPPVYAALIVDDTLAFPNSPWYQSVIQDRTPDAKAAVEAIGHVPAIWSLSDLEWFVRAASPDSASIPGLFKEYHSFHYARHGEWERWLAKKASSSGNHRLKWLVEGLNQYIDPNFPARRDSA